MQKGYLGTGTERRIIFIWEGAVANLPDKRAVQAMETVKCRVKLWDQAVDYWEISEKAVGWMWSIWMRSDMRIDLCVTTRPEPFAKAVTRLVELRNWPVRYVFAAAPADLGRLLPTMPDVDRVFYGLEYQRYAYGPKGQFFDGVGQII